MEGIITEHEEGRHVKHLQEFFSNITDKKAVRVTLPVMDRDEKERYNCLFVSERQPSFYLVFPPGDLPVTRIDQNRTCIVTVDFGGRAVSLIADIDSIKGDQIIQATGREIVDHEQNRNYFRVDAVTPVAAEPVDAALQEDADAAWRLVGETIDLSGSGMLCTFDAPMEVNQRVRVQLTLPTGAMDIIEVIGHVVRCREISESLYQIALHFDTIAAEEQDKIVGSCLEVQRKQLRMKVQIQHIL